MFDVSVLKRSSTSAPVARPGWPDIGVGLLVLIVVGLFGGADRALPISPIAIGLILAALSGIATAAGFLAAFALRIRAWEVFGVRRTSARWLMVGAGVGAITFVVKRIAVLAYISPTGDATSPQQIFIGVAGSALIFAAFHGFNVVFPVALVAGITAGEVFRRSGSAWPAMVRHGSSTFRPSRSWCSHAPLNEARRRGDSHVS